MSKVLGIIAEYNPFHNGHLYHIEESKRRANADYVVTVITGNFTQRGSTSIVDKWEKAKMALANGVDLVIELPTLYSISSAENFADGAIKILSQLEIINTLSYGTETEDVTKLDNIAEVLYKEPEEYREILKKELDKGISFPLARENALVEYLNDNIYKSIISEPNNILAIEYLKALKRQKSKIETLAIKRQKVNYNSKKIAGKFASSTGIRNLLENNQLEEVKEVVPNETFKIIKENIDNGTFNLNLNSFSKEIIYKLRIMKKSEILELPEISEGLENLIKEAVNKTNDVDELLNCIKSKRYTKTRIQRILLYSLLGISKQDMDLSKKIQPYIRILGFNENGKKLLSKINKNKNIITSVKKFEETNLNREYTRMLEIDKIATDIYTLGYQQISFSNLDYTKGIIKPL